MKGNEGKAGTVILVIILLLIFAMAGIYGYLYVTKLENRIIVLEQEANNKIEDNTQSTTNTIVSQETTNTSKTFTNEEIKTCIQNYLDIDGSMEGSPEGLLVMLKLTTYQEKKELTDDNYAKTNIKFLDFKNKMLNYMTENWFKKNFMTWYREVDGYLWYFDGGATGIDWKVESVALKGDYSNSSYIAKVYDDKNELQNIEFHIENNNGKCVISYCDC